MIIDDYIPTVEDRLTISGYIHTHSHTLEAIILPYPLSLPSPLPRSILLSTGITPTLPSISNPVSLHVISDKYTYNDELYEGMKGAMGRLDIRLLSLEGFALGDYILDGLGGRMGGLCVLKLHRIEFSENLHVVNVMGEIGGLGCLEISEVRILNYMCMVGEWSVELGNVMIVEHGKLYVQMILHYHLLIFSPALSSSPTIIYYSPYILISSVQSHHPIPSSTPSAYQSSAPEDSTP